MWFHTNTPRIMEALNERVEQGRCETHYDDSESTHWHLIEGRRWTWIMCNTPTGSYTPQRDVYDQRHNLDMYSLNTDWDEVKRGIV